MARAANGPGAATARAVQKTITVTREVVPAEEATTAEEDLRDPFDFMQSIPDDDWGNHSIYLYRSEPKTTRGPGEANLGVFSRPFTLEWLRNTYGGETFRILIKKGAQRVFDRRVTIELPPRYHSGEHIADGRTPLPAAAMPNTEAGAVAMMGTKMVDAAGQMVGNQPAVMQAMMGVFQDACAKATQMVISQIPPAKDPLETLRTAKEILAQPPAAAPATSSPLMELVMTKLVERFVTPPQDPISTFSSMLDAVKRTGLMGGGGRQADTWLEVARQVPVLGDQVVRGIHEWRLGVEAMNNKGTGGGAAPVVSITTPPAAPPPNALPAPSGQPSLEWIESRVVEIAMDANLSAAEAADEILLYLTRESQVLTSQLITLGESGILQLFRTRPILSRIPQNARLQDIVREFLSLAKEPALAPGPPEGTPPA